MDAITRENDASRHHVEDDLAERIDVGRRPHVQLTALFELGSHECPRPHDLGRFRNPWRFADQANPKIAQPEFMAPARKQDVLRLDIAMNDFGRMSGAQRAGNLLGDLQHGVDEVLVQA